jgi:XTP/dITP diphosphohydrolase
MEIVLATRNKKKVEEIQRILEGMDINILTLNDFPECPEVEENADTFEGNAIKKAIAISKCTGKMAVSDDSGLEVFALGGEPGVRSARYAGEQSDDLANNEKLLYQMRDFTRDARGAQFICIIAVATPDGKTHTYQGVVAGKVAKKAIGTKGFGYDPLFVPDGFESSFGEMSDEEKDSISHRRVALEKFKNDLKRLFS